MNSTPPCSGKGSSATSKGTTPDRSLHQAPLFQTSKEPPLTLKLIGIPMPTKRSRSDQQRTTSRPLPPNCHIPSLKNTKMWITKLPNGKPLKRPILITKPEHQEWKELAIQNLLSQLCSECQTGCDATPAVRSKLFAILSRLPEDDSVNDLREIHLRVEHVEPGQEGAVIEITRLN